MLALVAFLLTSCPLQSIIPVGMVNRPLAAPAPLPTQPPVRHPLLSYSSAPIVPAGWHGFIPWFRWRRPEENGIPLEEDDLTE